jgi:hypothetical protein
MKPDEDDKTESDSLNNIHLEEGTKDILKSLWGDNVLINKNLDAMFNHLKESNVRWNASEESRKVGIEFLNEAERDIKSCKLLHCKKIYPHSVYHLQQAIEKGLKGYCLGLGILTLGEIKGLHHTPFILMKGVLEKTGIKALIQELDEESREILMLWEIEEKAEKRLLIAKWSFKEIIQYLKIIDNYKSISINMVDALINLAKSSSKYNSNSSFLELTTITDMCSLYILGTISFPHESFTRYPDSDIKPLDYTKESGIVKATPKMLNYLKYDIKNLRVELSK